MLVNVTRTLRTRQPKRVSIRQRLRQHTPADPLRLRQRLHQHTSAGILTRQGSHLADGWEVWADATSSFLSPRLSLAEDDAISITSIVRRGLSY